MSCFNYNKGWWLKACVVAAFGGTACLIPAGRDGAFRCGEAPRGDDDSVQRCTRPNEVCICATGGCATRTRPKDVGTCATNLWYVEHPFSGTQTPNECVDTDDVPAEPDDGTRCNAPADAGAGDAG
jgi:hypothetical protein